jgi:hypothetical protein
MHQGDDSAIERARQATCTTTASRVTNVFEARMSVPATQGVIAVPLRTRTSTRRAIAGALVPPGQVGLAGRIQPAFGRVIP